MPLPGMDVTRCVGLPGRAVERAGRRRRGACAVAAREEHDSVNGELAGLDVTPVVRDRQAAEVLAAEARGADLLVVGSRGLGGFHLEVAMTASERLAA